MRDLWIFLFFYLLWVLMFGSAFCLLLGSTPAEEFGFHDASQPNAFESARMTIYSFLVLSFIGDFDPDNFPKPIDKYYLILYLLVTVVVQLNILIAIVSDSYDAAMARSEALYYRAHNDLITAAGHRVVVPAMRAADDRRSVDQRAPRGRARAVAGTGTTWAGSSIRLNEPAPRSSGASRSAPSRPSTRRSRDWRRRYCSSGTAGHV